MTAQRPSPPFSLLWLRPKRTLAPDGIYDYSGPSVDIGACVACPWAGLAGLERSIAVASNKNRHCYGYTPYDPSMIPKLLDIHRCYYNWIQVGARGKTRAERFGLAKGKIRHQDVIYYR